MANSALQHAVFLLCLVSVAAQEYLPFVHPAIEDFTEEGAILLTKDTQNQSSSKIEGGPEPYVATLMYVNGVFLFVMLVVVARVVMVQSTNTETVDRSDDKSIMQTFGAVLLWAGLGVTLIIFNKYLYMSKDKGGFGFPCPLALTWWHMFSGLLYTSIIRVVRPDLMPSVQAGNMNWKRWAKSVLPIGVIFAVYLGLGNMAYLYLSVHFVQMLKSAGPVAVHAIAVLMGMETVSTASVTAICIVVFGVFGASVGEATFNWYGFALQFAAFILDGFRLVLLKIMMSSRDGEKLDPLSGLHYYSPVCMVTLVGPVVYFEGATLMEVFASIPITLVALIVLNGMVAFSLNLSMLRLFSLVAATTVSVASVVRDVFLTFFSAMLFHSQITRVQVLGYFSAILGVKLWDEIKSRPEAFNVAFGLKKHEKGSYDETTCLLEKGSSK